MEYSPKHLVTPSLDTHIILDRRRFLPIGDLGAESPEASDNNRRRCSVGPEREIKRCIPKAVHSSVTTKS
jgi:hypothetical protein